MSGNNEITNTGGPASGSEPSMEEILASIRRILKDEEAAAEPPTEDVAAEEEDEDILLLDSAMVVPPLFRPAPELQQEPTALQSEATPEYPPPEEAVPVEEPPEKPFLAEADYASPEEQAPHLTSELPDPDFPEFGDETVDLPLHVTEAESEAGAEVTPEEIPDPVLLTEPEMADSVKEVHMPDYSQQNYQPPPGLVGASASEAAANSIGSLIRSISSERSIAVGRPGLTLEDLVREELRPLLKSWLDSNLPPLVERIVRAEIQRVVERSTI